MRSRILVKLVSFSGELADRARLVNAAGFAVDASKIPPGRAVGHIRDLSPAAVVIDLDRAPAHGRAIGIVLRTGKSTCHVPIVFAGGAPEKIARVRKDLPDAVCTTWRAVGGALHRAIEKAPAHPAQPLNYMQQWLGSSLVKKLGFKPGAKIALLGTPEEFFQQLGELPRGVEFQSAITPLTSLAIWFVRSRRELDGEVEFVSARLPDRVSIWIAFPKQAGRHRVDFNSNDVRAAGVAAGLVDYKICSIDADWSGLKFARKRSGKTPLRLAERGGDRSELGTESR